MKNKRERVDRVRTRAFYAYVSFILHKFFVVQCRDLAMRCFDDGAFTEALQHVDEALRLNPSDRSLQDLRRDIQVKQILVLKAARCLPYLY